MEPLCVCFFACNMCVCGYEEREIADWRFSDGHNNILGAQTLN